MLILTALLSFPARAEEAESQHEHVRVGFFAMDGYHMMDEDGNRSGYGYDFLRLMARYWDADYEYIGYDKSWEDMQRMLLDGEIGFDTFDSLVSESAANEIRLVQLHSGGGLITVAGGTLGALPWGLLPSRRGLPTTVSSRLGRAPEPADTLDLTVSLHRDNSAAMVATWRGRRRAGGRPGEPRLDAAPRAVVDPAAADHDPAHHAAHVRADGRLRVAARARGVRAHLPAAVGAEAGDRRRGTRESP